MKIKLPVFKDDDANDAITYQSWRWDVTVYHHVGCRDCTLLPYAIWSLQGYPGELVQSFRMDVLTILDKHYNNIKALDALNQELFQPLNGRQGDCVGLGHLPIETPQSSGHFISRMLPSQLSGQVEMQLLLWQATKMS